MDNESIAQTIGTHHVREGGFGGVDLKELPQMERLESRTIPIPGVMLNRLNPMKVLDLLSRAELSIVITRCGRRSKRRNRA